MNPFKFDRDASGMEKFVTIFAAFFIPALLIYLFGSVWGFWHNDLSAAAATASAGAHTLGTILLLVALAWFFTNALDFIPFKVADGLIGALTAVFLALSVLAYCGFFINAY